MTPKPPTTLAEKIRRFYASDIRLSFKIIATSLAIIVVSAVPLLLYVALGPRDGNPIGLGLLFMLGLFLGQLGLVIGFLRMLWEFFMSRR